MVCIISTSVVYLNFVCICISICLVIYIPIACQNQIHFLKSLCYFICYFAKKSHMSYLTSELHNAVKLSHIVLRSFCMLSFVIILIFRHYFYGIINDIITIIAVAVTMTMTMKWTLLLGDLQFMCSKLKEWNDQFYVKYMKPDTGRLKSWLVCSNFNYAKQIVFRVQKLVRNVGSPPSLYFYAYA